jgi:hypothetical protein
MRARARELRSRIFPERKPWTARVLELRRLADQAGTPGAVRQQPFAQPPFAQPPFVQTPLTGAARPMPITPHEEADEVPLGGPRPSLKAILLAVAAAFRVPVVDIMSHRRSRRICEARHAAYRIARDLTFLTLPQIGRRIGGRDHTTVLHGIRRTQALFPDLVLDPDASAESCAVLMARLYGDRQ